MQLPQMNIPEDISRDSIAVLCSGGVESCVLVARLCEYFENVYPVYVSFGLNWESIERDHLQRFLETLHPLSIKPLTVLKMPVDDLYADHWSVTGKCVPDETTLDEAVFIPGRNLLFFAKVSVWCHINKIENIAHGSLARNPFPDATEQFFSSAESTVGLALNTRFHLLKPLAGMHKEEVIQLGRDLSLSESFSCINPVLIGAKLGMHCGRCNKCHERRVAFRNCELKDATEYADIKTTVSAKSMARP